MKTWKSDLEAIPFGLYEKALPASFTWEQRLSIAHQAGYDFMEISIDETEHRLARLEWGKNQRQEILSAVEATGVEIKSLSLSAHRKFPLGSRSIKTRQTALDIFKKAIDLSLNLGLRFILLSGADIYYEDSDSDTEDWFLEGLEKGFEYASGAGMLLALENWDIRIDSLTKAMKYVDYFNSPWFQIYADIGNLVYADQDLFSELEAAKGHIAALHIKDTLIGQLRYVTPGEGQVPFVAAFAKLAELGFQGPAVLELWTENNPRAVEIVTQANTWVKTKMREGWHAYHQESRERMRSNT
jgi:predicted hexulose-6-phosphate isomerase